MALCLFVYSRTLTLPPSPPPLAPIHPPTGTYCATIRQNMQRKANQSFLDDIDLIRKSKDNLFPRIKEMHSLKTRLILMTELLYQAFEPRNKKGT